MHISELADFRVKHTEDVVKNGDEIWVKCIGIDDKGRVKLSRKAAMKERDEAAGPTEAAFAAGSGYGTEGGGDRGDRFEDRGDRGDRGDRFERGGDRGPRRGGRDRR